MNNELVADTPGMPDLRRRLLGSILEFVPFEGWRRVSFEHACDIQGIDLAEAMAACPRGALDLALEFQNWGDEQMVERLESMDLHSMRMDERIATAIATRIQVVSGHREAVRRMLALFSLPMNGQDGARSLWRTADRIWKFMGDSSDDFNWYTKRATLSAVIAASVVYWLGDSSDGSATSEFINRRIRNVMKLEALKSDLRKLPGGAELLKTFDGIIKFIRPPAHRRDNYPGWTPPEEQ